ncbi:polyprenyl synthetase family protein [Streptomyces sp. NPDC048106]|uniref:polyprenyl synthetase family protein n=1 Tax=Streptomyces sp. NPDC048106 TaxID=3155750 RepID=UPI003452B259
MPLRADLTAFPHLEAGLDRVRDFLGPVGIPGRFELAALTGDQSGASGGLVRPTLALLSYWALTDPAAPAGDRAVRAAAAVEMMHLGSLYHDDVLDHADERRGRPSTNAVWGAHLAVLGGDCVMLTSLRMMAELGRREVLAAAKAGEQMCASMVIEAADRYVAFRSEQSYLDTIDGKTAALLSLACRVGAMQAGRGEEQEELLAGFGRQLGLAYQLCDDILDLTSTPEELGKPVNTDLIEGVYTLPVIRAAARDAGLRRLLREGMTQKDAAHVRELVIASGAVQEGQELVEILVKQAVGHLTGLAGPPHIHRALEACARTLLDRTRVGPALPRQNEGASRRHHRTARPRRTIRSARNWFLQSGLVTDPAQFEHHQLTDMFRFPVDHLPPSTQDRAETAVGLLAMTMLWDDLFEDPRLDDPQDATTLRRGLVTTLRQGPHASWTQAAIPRAWAQLWPRLCEGRTTGWQKRFLDSFETRCEASEREVHHRLSGHVPATTDYLPLRAARKSDDIAFAFFDVWLDQEVPPKVRSHPVARRIEELVGSVVFMENDLVAPEQDESEQSPYSLVRMVRHETGCTFEEAVTHVRRRAAERRAQLDATAAYAPVLLRALSGRTGREEGQVSLYENLMSVLPVLRRLDRSRGSGAVASQNLDLERLRREICRPAASSAPS